MEVRKPDLDDEVWDLLHVALGRGLSKRKLSLITTAFLYAILHSIAERREVVIKGFGKFQRRIVGNRIIVEFTPTKYLSTLSRLQGDPMDKYAVEEEPRNEKLAAEGCPKCGKPLIEQGPVLLCPVHGSEPFEKEKKS